MILTASCCFISPEFSLIIDDDNWRTPVEEYLAKVRKIGTCIADSQRDVVHTETKENYIIPPNNGDDRQSRIKLKQIRITTTQASFLFHSSYWVNFKDRQSHRARKKPGRTYV